MEARRPLECSRIWVSPGGRLPGSIHGVTYPPNTHFLTAVTSWKWSCSYCLVTSSCPILCNPIDCNLPGSSVHGIFQTKILEGVAVSCSGGSSQIKGQTHLSRIGRRILYHAATKEAFCGIER